MYQDNEVVSTNNGEYLSDDSKEVTALCRQIEDMEEKEVDQEETNDQKELYLMQEIQSTNYKIIGVISLKEAFEEQFNIFVIIIPIVMITGIAALFTIIMFNQQNRPLRKIACTA